jgi:hypothetical protein
MSKPPTFNLIVRLSKIKDLADDLSRELIRAGVDPGVQAMASAVRNEADDLLVALEDSPEMVRFVRRHRREAF